VQFDDTSKDPDGRISAWQWDFGAPDQVDNSATVSSQYHCYQQSGTYTVALTVTDDLGAKATTTQQVTVTVPPPEPPPEQGV
jgi:PKD repeat protein